MKTGHSDLSSATWLLFMHQLPTKPEALRVKTWRHLQKIGALQIKNSVYILPLNSHNRKQFEFLAKDLAATEAEAFLCESKFIAGIENSMIINKFNLDRAGRYNELSQGMRQLLEVFKSKKPNESALMKLAHSIGKIERQLNELKAIDFFSCPEQISSIKLFEGLLKKIAQVSTGKQLNIQKRDIRQFKNRTWVTRANPHVDRLASAWLIQKIIDSKAKFKFVSDHNYRAKDSLEICFDMYFGEFTHIGDLCTFEVLYDSFSLKCKALMVLKEIIHDLDLKDTKFNRPETPGISLMLEGIIKSEKNDIKRQLKAFELFDDIYLSLKN
jgi:hypothetical protein